MRSTTRSSLDWALPRAAMISCNPVRISRAELAAVCGINRALSDGAARRYRPRSRSAARFKRRGGFVGELLDDLGDGLLARDHANRLAGHDRAGFDIAVDHRAAQRSGPIMLDLEL